MARIGWRVVVRFPGGRIAPELLTLVCLRLRPAVAPAILAFLTTLVVPAQVEAHE
jgi:hypothetical protein